MNFNLVSDEDNGHRYTAYFGEQIQIPAGSKAYLNFAALYRENGHFLNEDATLTLSVPNDFVIPTHVVNDAGDVVSNEGITYTETIPAGKYTTAEMQTKLRDAITKICRTDAGNPTPPPLDTDGRLRYYYSYEPDTFNPDAELIVNLSYRKDLIQQDIALDGVNGHNNDYTNGDYTKAADAVATSPLSFDNYGLGTLPIFHYQDKDTDDRQKAQIEFVTSGTNNDGSVFMGLYNADYAALPIPLAEGATQGNNAPRVLTVLAENLGEFDPDIIPPGAEDKTALPTNPTIFFTPPPGTTYAEDFKMTVTPSGVGSAAIVIPSIALPFTVTGLLSRFDYTAGTITGLLNNNPYTLTQSASSGLGSGATLSVTSSATGEITSVEMAAAVCKISSPGTLYEVGDTITFEETTTPGVGSVQVTVTKVCNAGACNGILQPADARLSDRDPDTATRTMGSGFVGGETVSLTQNVQGIVAEPATLLDYATAAASMIPACFVGVEVAGQDTLTPYADGINIYVALDEDGAFIGNPAPPHVGQDIDIANMHLVDSVAKPTAEERLHVAIRTYAADPLELDVADETFFEVGYFDQEGGFTVVYDSITDFISFTDSTFMKGQPVTDLSTQNLQAPFKPFFSVQKLGEYISDSVLLPYDMNSDTEDAGNKKPSMIQKLQLTASSELARTLGWESPQFIMPSSDYLNKVTMRITDVGLHWANASYYVVIEELPLTNYKNKRTRTIDGTGKIKKGMVKNILANIPLPFESAASSILTPSSSDALLIGGLYEPPKKIIVNLKNNKILTNQFSVSVFRMEDDKPATELQQSVINFTIMEGEEEE